MRMVWPQLKAVAIASGDVRWFRAALVFLNTRRRRLFLACTNVPKCYSIDLKGPSVSWSLALCVKKNKRAGVSLLGRRKETKNKKSYF